jgi:hypothetical protein
MRQRTQAFRWSGGRVRWIRLLEMTAEHVDPDEERSASAPIAFCPHIPGEETPTNEFHVLSSVLGPPMPSGGSEHGDLVALERDMGVGLPSDFKAFIDTYGVGVFCDIRIVGPDPCTDFDMGALMRHEIEQMASSERVRVTLSHRGLLVVPWGVTSGGWICGWSANGPDPERWGTTSVGPGLRLRNFNEELSFSTYLLHYSCHRDQLLVSFEEDRWRGGIAFAPHRHQP